MVFFFSVVLEKVQAAMSQIKNSKGKLKEKRKVQEENYQKQKVDRIISKEKEICHLIIFTYK